MVPPSDYLATILAAGIIMLESPDPNGWDSCSARPYHPADCWDAIRDILNKQICHCKYNHWTGQKLTRVPISLGFFYKHLYCHFLVVVYFRFN